MPPTPVFSPLWVPCERKHSGRDYGTPLWKAWWGQGMVIEKQDAFQEPVDSFAMEVDTPSSSPRTFKTIDLSDSLHIRAPARMLIRREYDLAVRALETSYSLGVVRGAIITGQPGIGKTYFLWYLLRYRLNLELPTLFQIGDYMPLFFCDKGAYERNSAYPELPALVQEASDRCHPYRPWVLVDMGKKKAEPPDMIIDGPVYVVQTTSPDEVRYKGWSKESTHGQPPSHHIMNPWSWEEILDGLFIQPSYHPDKLDLARLQASFYRHGPVPRTVYWAYLARDADISRNEDAFKVQLDMLTLPELRTLVQNAKTSNPSSEISHKIVRWSRAADTPFDTFGKAIDPLSSYVMLHLVRSTAFRTLDEKRQVFQLFAGIAQASSGSRGWLFETFSHGVLSSPFDGTQLGLELIKLIPSSDKQTTYSATSLARSEQLSLQSRSIRLFHGAADFIDTPALDNIYHIPVAPNSLGFDSFLIIDRIAYIFQMTVSTEHRFDSKKQAGIALLRKIVPRSVTVWRYVLVVPHAVMDHKLTGVDQEGLKGSMEFLITTMDLPK